MFLSRLRLHPRDLDVLRDIADAEQLHRTVMRAFPQHDGADARAAFGVLFRLEVQRERPVALVQSTVEPDWSQLPEGYLLQHEHKDITGFLESIERGRRFHFRLLANPSKKVSNGGRNSRRVALLDEAGQRDWLRRRAERSGFDLLAADHVRIAPRRPLGNGGRGRKGLHVRPVLFEGALTVTDAEAFRHTLASGVGPAKAYGCGLLSLA